MIACSKCGKNVENEAYWREATTLERRVLCSDCVNIENSECNVFEYKNFMRECE